MTTCILASWWSSLLADDEQTAPSPGPAASAVSAEHARFFESQVRPLLVRRCLECHESNKRKGRLSLQSRADVLQGGDSGPALVPGVPDESLLIEAVRYQSLEMPPAGPLSDKEIAVLVKWVELGAPWPEDAGGVPRHLTLEKITDEDRAWWAFQPVVDPPVPQSADNAWARNSIDRFVWERMRAQGLEPAPETDRATLARRLYFDLWGLPATFEQVQAFLADTSENAYERLVEQLLSSPRYGEHWARYWLDLVRYADSDGYRIDHYRPEAWRYRDYVIRALNADKPYDRFVQEQLAGDELFPGDTEAMIATGYLRQGIYEYNNRDVPGQWDTMLNDITDVTGDVFLGMGMQCARCHDHKFDPILQADYYRLQAFFAPLLPRDDLSLLSEEELRERVLPEQTWAAATADLRQQIDEIEAPYRERARAGAIAKFPPETQQLLAKPVSEQSPIEHQLAELAFRQVLVEYAGLDGKLSPEHKEQVLALRKELSKFDSLRPSPVPHAQAATDVGPIAPPLFMPKREIVPIEPGFLTIFDPQSAHIEPLATAPQSTGRRAALARWLTRHDNPLSTRVIVNRIWQRRFGRGLAANASDFGRLGDPPSHPELLDWLTSRFVSEGWSLKRLHTVMLTSATYRQAARHPRFAELQKIDPENRWYWRQSTRRLDAEQIRDAVLAVSGQLNDSAGGPGVEADVPRRTIYTRVMRNARDPLLEAFDLPLFFSSVSSRNTTTTPVQSLLMINSTQMLHHAAALADRAWTRRRSPELSQPGAESDPAELHAALDRAWCLALGRMPDAEERSTAERFLTADAESALASASPGATDVPVGQLPYRDGQAVLLQDGGSPWPLQAADDSRWPSGDFTVEAYFQVRSVYDTGAVRTIAAKWQGNTAQPGWGFGVTGKQSRRKPQTLVLQLCGVRRDGTFGEAAVFSDQHIELNKPYFVAASVRLAGSEPGRVTFYLKDLSNDDEPLLVAEVPHEIQRGFENHEPVSLGARSGLRPGLFDGLIDDVRISRGALPSERLLLTAEAPTDETVALWQFEVEPGLYRDSSDNHLDLVTRVARTARQTPLRAAFVDLCHALLNSNEFLYVP